MCLQINLLTVKLHLALLWNIDFEDFLCIFIQNILIMYVFAATKNILTVLINLSLMWNTCFEDFFRIFILNTHSVY